MANPIRLILDTDPGVDDIFALLSVLATKTTEIELLLISITHGNVDAENCLRNVVTLFDVLRKESEWRKQKGIPESFQAESCPIVASGATGPLSAVRTLADYYHGRDGLGGTHTSHPHLSPPDTWKEDFAWVAKTQNFAPRCQYPSMRPSDKPSHKEILRILRENDPDSITIVAIGPLTNIALAAEEDLDTFLKVKEVVVMGGSLDCPGNITPVAEFNTYADPHAADRIFSLTKVLPDQSTSQSLSLRLFPLDITVPHKVRKSKMLPIVSSLSQAGSPLGEWMEAILGHTFARVANLEQNSSENSDLGLSMHDPLCIWYVLTRKLPGWKDSTASPEDIRVETEGRWTRGMCITDRRGRKRSTVDVPGDRDGWLNILRGNRVWRVIGSPGTEEFENWIIGRIFPSLAMVN